ncbi:MAG: tRNA (adenosine(37)-N6)-threonylcarbamoyltransferase complex ATPase subunit type 1 TsaE [Pseudomonadota bacterium]
MAGLAETDGAQASGTIVPAWLRKLVLSGPPATDRLGRAMAPFLGAGGPVLLSGDLGAGKSALARAVVRARLGDPAAEVPSPTYTLANVYAPPEGPAIWHADLYRLSGPDDLLELGLEEAFDTAVTLVEWPSRLGAPLPRRRLEITLTDTADGAARDAAILALGDGWTGFAARLDRLVAEGGGIAPAGPGP